MANCWFISDIHFGHKAITKYRTQFSSEEEHRLTIKENIQSVVKKRDLLWILGDSIMEESCLQDLKDINCHKNLVIGNHCAQHFDQWKLYECFDKVFGLTKKYGAWLTHCPVHSDELRGAFCVHGHTHNHIIDDPRYINMCVEHHDFKPIDLRHLRMIIDERKTIIEEDYKQWLHYL